MTVAEYEAEWEQAGRDIAGALDGCSAVVVTGDDPIATAAAALGIARVHAARRRVAVGDLIGDVEPIRALVTTPEPDGIADTFLYGISLNKIAQPADDTGNLFVLPSGSESPAREEILANGRWRRLAAGFHEVGALLLLAAPASAPALGALARQLDGIVLVGDAGVPTLEAPLLAHVRRARRMTPPPIDLTEEIVPPPARTRWGFLAIVIVALAALALAGRIAWTKWIAVPVAASAAHADTTPAMRPATMPPESAVADSMRRDSARTDSMLRGNVRSDSARRDTTRRDSAGRAAARSTGDVAIASLTVVNPGDSLAASAFAIEMLAANTEDGAMMRLRDVAPGATTNYPAATVSPVVGTDRTQWFKVLVGAYPDRAQADSLLRNLLARKAITRGVIVRAPIAFLLDSAASRSNATALVADYAMRGVPAYALAQRDGSTRIYVGAFATIDDAVPLARRLRDKNIHATLAYRVGSPS